MPGRKMECRIHQIYLWTSLVSFVSCVVCLVAFGSPSWTEGGFGDYEYLQTGLLLFCHHRNSKPGDSLCAPLLFGSQKVWFEAVRLMSLLSWIFLFTVFVMGIVLSFLDDKQVFSLPLVITGLLAGVMGIVAAVVYVVPWTTQTVIGQYDVSISWGYAVYIIGHIITLFLFISVCVASRDVWMTQFRLRRRHT